eukprot:7063154-Lingulodinium_polyedra.AAC.1
MCNADSPQRALEHTIAHLLTYLQKTRSNVLPRSDAAHVIGARTPRAHHLEARARTRAREMRTAQASRRVFEHIIAQL